MEDYYISHHALVEAVNGVSTHWLNDWSTVGVLAMIDRQQAADVVPVVHGLWMWTERGPEDWEKYYVCSNCGEHTFWQTNYCHDCGAKMDMEDKVKNEREV